MTYLGCVCGTRAALRRMVPRDRGVDRPGRLRARLPRHPAAGALLRRQARDRGLHRIAARRAHARRSARADHHGPPAGAEHAAVRASCRTKLPRHPQPVPPIYQPEVAAEAIVWVAEHRAPRALGRRVRPCRRSSATASRPGSATATSRAPATTPSRPTSRSTADRPDNLSSRCPAITARTAASTTRRPHRAARSPGSRATAASWPGRGAAGAAGGRRGRRCAPTAMSRGRSRRSRATG